MIEREWISKEEAKETLPDVPNFTDEIYKSPVYKGPIALAGTLGVKFSNNIFIHKSSFKTFKINATDEELDESFMGLGIYKFDKEGNISEKWIKYIENNEATE